MGRRAMSAKVKAAAKRPRAGKAPKQEAAGIRELEKRLAEAIEQQTATAEILKVISSSPTDIQPVLDAVAESAARLCDARDVIVRRVDGDVYRLVAYVGSMRVTPSPPAVAISRRTFMGRAIRERRTIHIHDVLDPDVREEYPESLLFLRQDPAYRTVLCVPLLREDTAIGVIIMRRPEMRPFSDQQIKLLETFAAQAAIAIENTRLFNETQEALEQQTATADILRVISSSPTDLQPVFDAILEKAIHLCDAHMGNLALYHGEKHQIVAQRGASAEYAKYCSERGPFRTSGSLRARMIAERQPIQVADRRDSPEYRDRRPGTVAIVELGGARTYMIVPMLKEGRVVGDIAIYRPVVQPFTQKQIDLVSIFANQAVIAIENVRLFNETKEALEQQTVISEILRVISSSPTDTQPVFDAIVKSGVHLFGGMNVTLRLVKGDHIETVASTNPLYVTGSDLPNPLGDEGMPGSRAILRREVVQIPDYVTAEKWVSPMAKQRAEERGFRALMSAPMLREFNAIGTINVIRATPGPFSDKQIALVKTFADQAVIAIENVRLFKELQARNAEVTESLEQQTATADILRVISSSPTDLQPVFDAILEKAIRLCDAHMGQLGLYDGEKYQNVALRGASAEYAKYLSERGPFRPGASSAFARMIAERQPVHVADRRDSPEYRDRLPGVVELVELGGARTVIVVPMLKEGRVVGGIAIYRPEVRPFTQKQIDLVSTFASQAVIAIENARLFTEINEALQRQTSIAEILRVISSSPTDVMPVLETVTHRAAQLCDAPDARLYLVDGDTLRYVTGFGELKGVAQTLPLTRGSTVGRAIIDQSVMHIEDIVAAFDDFPEARAPSREFGQRTTLAVPLVRESKAFGAILMRRKEVRPFTEKQIELVKTFADQAVIAIENVRLFNEIQDKSRQLEVASRHKSQFLANMSHELRTPLNAILGYTELVLDGIYGDVSEKIRDVMGRVDRSGRHLLGLINDVLDLSKIEAGQLSLALADYSLTDVVQTVLTSVESLAAEKKLALKSTLASDLPRGRGDDRRLAQVLLNLVGNAIKFTETGEVRLEARCSDGEFVVAVADTGPGISEADQQRIFEEFQQVDDSATRKKGGTGLGLSIARRIVELHGGRIQVESAPGRGATFTVTLPIRVERQAVPA